MEDQDFLASVESVIRQRAAGRLNAPSRVPSVSLDRIIHIDDFEISNFSEKGGFETPFVIKGVFDDAPLEWRYLRDMGGDSVVPVHPAPELGEDWQYQVPLRMKLREAMREIEQGRALGVVSSSQVFVDHPELLMTLRVRDLAAMFNLDVIRYEMFVAGPGTGSAFHCACGGNLFLMGYGRKRWTLVRPQDSFAMYPTIGRSNSAAMFGSPINSETYEREQLERYPLYGSVPKYHVTLDPGDLLFVPSWWWHEVKNLDLTVGVPIRAWIGARNFSGSNPFFLFLTILSRYGLSHFSRFLAAYASGDLRWTMGDGIPGDSFGGSRPAGWKIVPRGRALER